MTTIIKSCITLTLVASTLGMNAQTGNHVFSGAEAANFGTIDLTTPPGTTWSTYRGAVPGYFSAVGTATYINANDMHNVDGYVKHYANAADQTYNFPVGTGTDYRSLAISGNIPATAVIATAWIAGDPTSTEDPTSTGAASGMHPITSSSAPIVAVSPIGQWDWQDFADNATGVTVTVSIPDVISFSLESNLRLVGWNGTEWVNLSDNTGASGSSEDNTLSGTMISGITAIGIGTIEVLPPLSVQLFSFTAQAQECTATLNWEVGAENNVKGYEIETSTDGIYFSNIGFVAANGAQNYSFQTNMIAGKNNYYRLRMIAVNGDAEVSTVKTIFCNNGNTAINIYPNPTNNEVLIENMEFGTNEIQVVNTLGQVIYSNVVSGKNTKIELKDLPAGSYYLTIKNGASLVSKTIIKIYKSIDH